MKRILLLLLMMIVFVPMASAEKFCKGCKFNEEEFPKTYPVIMKYVHEIQDKWQPSEFMARGDVIVLIYDVKINKDGTIPWFKIAGSWCVLPYLSKDFKRFRKNIDDLILNTPIGALPKEFEGADLIVRFYFCYVPYFDPPNLLYTYVDDEDISCMPSLDEEHNLAINIFHNSKVKRGLFRKKPIRKGHFDANLHSDDLRKK